MLAPRTGELLRSMRTGEIFAVKMTKDDRILLQSLDGAIEVLTGRVGLDLFYEEIPEQRRDDSRARNICAAD